MYVEDAGVGATRSREQAGHLGVGGEEGDRDDPGAAWDPKLQNTNVADQEKLGRSAQHPAVTGEEVLDTTLVILHGGGVCLGAVVHRLTEQARRRENRYASDAEKTAPAPPSVTQWPR